MYLREAVLILLILYKDIFTTATELRFRQKRCIVVQKQSGTHGVSSEDGDGADDEAYRKPQMKDPRPDRVVDGSKENEDFENLSHHFLKYKMPLKKTLNNFKFGTKKSPSRWSHKSWSLKQRR